MQSKQAVNSKTGGAPLILNERGCGRTERKREPPRALLIVFSSAFSFIVSVTGCGATVPGDQLKILRQLINDGKFNQAAALVAVNEVCGREDADFHLLQAELLRLTGQTDEAIKQYQTAASLAPANPAPLIVLSELFIQNLQLEASLRCAEQAMLLAPNSAPVRIAFASALLKNDRNAEAERQIAHLEQFESQRSNPEVKLLVYRLARKRGDFSGARQALEFVIAKAERRDPHWQVELADLQESEGRYADARQELERLLQADPGYREARYRLARLFEFRFHDYVSAGAVYKDLLKLDPDSLDAVGGIDRCRRKQRDVAARLKSTLKDCLQKLNSGRL